VLDDGDIGRVAVLAGLQVVIDDATNDAFVALKDGAVTGVIVGVHARDVQA
jgi:hypothetical protein